MSLGPKIVPFPKQNVPQTTVSICYALSLHKVYKLLGSRKVYKPSRVLAFSCNKATPWEVFMVLVSMKGGGGGGWRGWGVVGSLSRWGGWGGRGGWKSPVRCDSTSFVKDFSSPPLPMPQTSQPPPRCPGVAFLQGNRQTLYIVYKLS